MTSTATGTGVGLIAFGAIVALFGWAAFTVCSTIANQFARNPAVPGPQNPNSAAPPNCSFPELGAAIGIILLVVGVIVLVASYNRYTYVAPPMNPAIPPPLIQPVVIQQTVEREVVLVRCRFCGTLGNPGAGRCSACGAPL